MKGFEGFEKSLKGLEDLEDLEDFRGSWGLLEEDEEYEGLLVEARMTKPNGLLEEDEEYEEVKDIEIVCLPERFA